MWTSDKLVGLGKSASDLVFAVQQWPGGCVVVSFPSKRGTTFLLDVMLKMRCSCTLVKPHSLSETTSSTEWADFWRSGCDKEWIFFLGFWDHCSMEVLQKEPLTVPLASSPNPVVQSIFYLSVPVREGLQREEEPSLEGRCLRTWKPAWKMLGEWTVMAGWVEVKWPQNFSLLGFFFPQSEFTNSMIAGLVSPFLMYWQQALGQKNRNIEIICYLSNKIRQGMNDGTLIHDGVWQGRNLNVIS